MMLMILKEHCRVSLSLTLSTLLVLMVQAVGHAEPQQNFDVKDEGRSWSFPKDHGFHPGFSTEWWYFTGVLFEGGVASESKKPAFGTQLTFFRRENREQGATPNTAMFAAHAAVSDLRANRFLHQKLFFPAEVLGIAQASEDSLDVRLGSWRATTIADQFILEYEGRSHGKDFKVRLISAWNPSITLHGANGLSRKGNCEGCFSYYYSLPRIPVQGEVVVGEQKTEVHGTLWMDHEFMNNTLRSDVEGWDWLSLRLPNGASVMVFRVRRLGDVPSYYAGTYIGSDASSTHLTADDFSFTAIDHWTSSSSKARYPVTWRLQIKKFGIDTTITALMQDQEMTGHAGGLTGGPNYWEGIVGSADQSSFGYLELTGYDKPIGALF